MTIMQKMDVAAPEGSIGPRLIPTTPDGFPRNNLTALFLFREVATASGFADAVTGNMAPLDGAADPLTGGGVRLTGLSKITGPEFHIQARWTIMLGLTQPAPSTGGVSGRRTLVSVGPYEFRGLHAWINPAETDDLGTNAPCGVYANRSVAGVEGVYWPGMPKPFVARYGKPQTLVLRHHGGGDVSIQQRMGNAVQQVSSTWDMDKITGPADNKSALMPLNIGSRLGFAGGSTIYDAVALHTLRDLTEPEIRKFTAAHEALAAARGRA